MYSRCSFQLTKLDPISEGPYSQQCSSLIISLLVGAMGSFGNLRCSYSVFYRLMKRMMLILESIANLCVNSHLTKYQPGIEESHL